MRTWLIAFVCLAVSAAGAGAHEFGISRPGGVFTIAPADTADACASACERDTICIAWTWRAGVCELKAVAPHPVVEAGAVSGLSARAPAFARAMTVETRIGAPPAPELRAAFAPLTPQAPPPESRDDDIELLGGPIAEGEGSPPSQS